MPLTPIIEDIRGASPMSPGGSGVLCSEFRPCSESLFVSDASGTQLNVLQAEGTLTLTAITEDSR